MNSYFARRGLQGRKMSISAVEDTRFVLPCSKLEANRLEQATSAYQTSNLDTTCSELNTLLAVGMFAHLAGDYPY